MTLMYPAQATASLEVLSQAYTKYAELLLRHCCFRKIVREDAEEIVQDAFVQTFEYITRGNGVENMKVFLFKVTNNLIIDYVRHKHGIQDVSLDELEEKGVEFDGGSDHASSVHQKIEAGTILAEMRELQETDYELLHMRYIDGLTPSDIAQKKGMKSNSVSVRLHRLLKRVTSAVQVRQQLGTRR